MRIDVLLRFSLPLALAGTAACRSSPPPQPVPVAKAADIEVPAGPGYALWRDALGRVPAISLPPIDRNDAPMPTGLTDVAAVQRHLALLADPPRCEGAGPPGETLPLAAVDSLRIGLYIAQQQASAGAPKLAVAQLRQTERAADALWSCGMSLQAQSFIDAVRAEADNVLFGLLARRTIEADRVVQSLATTDVSRAPLVVGALAGEQRHVHREFRQATGGLVIPGVVSAVTRRHIDRTFDGWRAALTRGDRISPVARPVAPRLAALHQRLVGANDAALVRNVLQTLDADERAAAEASRDGVGTLLADMSLQRVATALSAVQRRRADHANVRAVLRRAANEMAVATHATSDEESPAAATVLVRHTPFEVRSPGADAAVGTDDDVVFAYLPPIPEDKRAVCVPLGPDGFAVFDKALLAAPDAMTTLSRQARVVPEVQGGTTLGFRFKTVRRGSIPAQCGLRAGDVVRSVNGRALTSSDAALAAYLELREAGVYDVEVVRARSTITLHYERALRAALVPAP